MVDFLRVGERIREGRKNKKMTQAVLAENAGISTEYVCEIENCKKRASLTALIGISMALDISMDELLNGSREEDQEMRIIALVLKDCSDYERKVICNNVSELKRILRENIKDGMRGDTKTSK